MQCSAGLCYDKKGRRSQMFKEGWKAIRDTSGRHSHKQSTTCRARGLRDQWGRGAKRNEREKRKHQDYNEMAREFGPPCVQMGFTSLLSASPAPGLSQLPRNSSCPRGLCQTGVESMSQWRWPNISAKVGRNCEGSGHFVADHCLSWRRRIKSCWGNRIVSWCDVMGELDHLLITETALQKFCLKKNPKSKQISYVELGLNVKVLWGTAQSVQHLCLEPVHVGFTRSAVQCHSIVFCSRLLVLYFSLITLRSWQQSTKNEPHPFPTSLHFSLWRQPLPTGWACCLPLLFLPCCSSASFAQEILTDARLFLLWCFS